MDESGAEDENKDDATFEDSAAKMHQLAQHLETLLVVGNSRHHRQGVAALAAENVNDRNYIKMREKAPGAAGRAASPTEQNKRQQEDEKNKAPTPTVSSSCPPDAGSQHQHKREREQRQGSKSGVRPPSAKKTHRRTAYQTPATSPKSGAAEARGPDETHGPRPQGQGSNSVGAGAAETFVEKDHPPGAEVVVDRPLGGAGRAREEPSRQPGHAERVEPPAAAPVWAYTPGQASSSGLGAEERQQGPRIVQEHHAVDHFYNTLQTTGRANESNSSGVGPPTSKSRRPLTAGGAPGGAPRMSMDASPTGASVEVEDRAESEDVVADLALQMRITGMFDHHHDGSTPGQEHHQVVTEKFTTSGSSCHTTNDGSDNSQRPRQFTQNDKRSLYGIGSAASHHHHGAVLYSHPSSSPPTAEDNEQHQQAAAARKSIDELMMQVPTAAYGGIGVGSPLTAVRAGKRRTSAGTSGSSNDHDVRTGTGAGAGSGARSRTASKSSSSKFHSTQGQSGKMFQTGADVGSLSSSPSATVGVPGSGIGIGVPVQHQASNTRTTALVTAATRAGTQTITEDITSFLHQGGHNNPEHSSSEEGDQQQDLEAFAGNNGGVDAGDEDQSGTVMSASGSSSAIINTASASLSLSGKSVVQHDPTRHTTTSSNLQHPDAKPIGLIINELVDSKKANAFIEQQQHLLQDHHLQQGKNLVADTGSTSTYHGTSEPAAPHHEEDLQARSREIKDHDKELRKKDKKEKKLKKEQRRLEKKEKKRLKGEQDTSEDKLREGTSVLAGGETDPDGSRNAPRPEGEILVRSPQPGTTTKTGGQEQFSSGPPSARSSRFSSSYDCKPKSPAANSCAAAAAGARPTKVDLGPSWTTGTTNQFTCSRAASKTRSNCNQAAGQGFHAGGITSKRDDLAPDPPTGETMRTISMRATHPSMGFRQQLNPASVATADSTSPSKDLPEYQPRPRRTATPRGTGSAAGSSTARDLMMLRMQRDGTINTGMNTGAVDPDLADAKAPAAVSGPVPAPPYEVVQPLEAIAAEAADAAFVQPAAPPPPDGSTRTASSTLIGTTTGSSSGDDSTSSQIDPRAENLNPLELATTIKEMEQQLISTAGSTPSSAGTRSRPYMRPSASGIFKVIASSGAANAGLLENQGREGDESGSGTAVAQEQDITKLEQQDLPEKQENSRPFEGATNRQHPLPDVSAPLSPSRAVGGEKTSPSMAVPATGSSSPTSSPSSKFAPSMPKFRCPESPRQMGANGRPRTRPLPIDQKVLVFPEDVSSTTVAASVPTPPPPPTGSKSLHESISPNGPWPEDLVPPEAAHEHADYTWMWNENAGPSPPTHLSQPGAAASRTNHHHAAAIESDEAEPAQPSQQLHQEVGGPWRPCAPPPETQ
ncbi:unnamed protein product [Amoebophrya sp. A120]|nr:unnamed protein product [Amoebophrya sp. A120]|eukprot:GSA120T00016919001.1